MLVTPVVDFEGSLLHGHALHTLFKLVEHVLAGGVEVLVIDAIDQYEMTEDVFGNGLAPWHLLAGSEGIANLVEEEFGSIVGEVAIRHVGIEELHGLFLCSTESVKR